MRMPNQTFQVPLESIINTMGAKLVPVIPHISNTTLTIEKTGNASFLHRHSTCGRVTLPDKPFSTHRMCRFSFSLTPPRPDVATSPFLWLVGSLPCQADWRQAGFVGPDSANDFVDQRKPACILCVWPTGHAALWTQTCRAARRRMGPMQFFRSAMRKK